MALLSLSNIHKTFEKGTVNENHVLRGLDLDIEQGDFISVIGGNGAGKSTLMNSIAGVVEIDEGDIVLDGNSIRKASVAARSKDISRVFQDPRMGRKYGYCLSSWEKAQLLQKINHRSRTPTLQRQIV